MRQNKRRCAESYNISYRWFDGSDTRMGTVSQKMGKYATEGWKAEVFLLVYIECVMECNEPAAESLSDINYTGKVHFLWTETETSTHLSYIQMEWNQNIWRLRQIQRANLRPNDIFKIKP